MKPLEFIRKIIGDLKLGEIGPNMQKTLELRIGEVVDQQIEEALVSTLTEDDWNVYNRFQKEHPGASPTEAMNAMLESRPELQKTIEDTLMTTYEDILVDAEAMEGMGGENIS